MTIMILGLLTNFLQNVYDAGFSFRVMSPLVTYIIVRGKKMKKEPKNQKKNTLVPKTKPQTFLDYRRQGFPC